MTYDFKKKALDVTGPVNMGVSVEKIESALRAAYAAGMREAALERLRPYLSHRPSCRYFHHCSCGLSAILRPES